MFAATFLALEDRKSRFYEHKSSDWVEEEQRRKMSARPRAQELHNAALFFHPARPERTGAGVRTATWSIVTPSPGSCISPCVSHGDYRYLVCSLAGYWFGTQWKRHGKPGYARDFFFFFFTRFFSLRKEKRKQRSGWEKQEVDGFFLSR